MEFSINNLKKYIEIDLEIDEKINFEEEIKDEEDILGISDAQVKGIFYYEEDTKEYIFEVDLLIELKLMCSITLEEVPYKIDLSTEYVFKEVIGEEDDVYQIIDQKINLKDIIWSDILVEKPMKVTKEGADVSKLGLFTKEDQAEMKKENSPFSSLKNFFDNK